MPSGTLLEGAEENQVVPEIVWACFVTAGLWQSSALWAQVAAEDELGACSPIVFRVNSMAILLNAVRVRGNKQHSILHNSIIRDQYISSLYLVRTSMY